MNGSRSRQDRLEEAFTNADSKLGKVGVTKFLLWNEYRMSNPDGLQSRAILDASKVKTVKVETVKLEQSRLHQTLRHPPESRGHRLVDIGMSESKSL